MTNPQYLLKYPTDKEVVGFMIWCITVRPEEFLVVYRKNSFLGRDDKKPVKL
jgi:hypothetical protein